MKKISSLLLVLVFLFNTSVAQADFTLSPTVHAFEAICLEQNLSPLNRSLTEMCEVVVKNELCKKVPKEDLLRCETIAGQSQIDFWAMLEGCAKGAFNSIKDTLVFLWEVMVWAWDNTTSSEKRSESLDEAKEYMAMAKLYLHTEYQKAYARSNPPLKEAKALASMGGAIAKLLLDKISDAVSSQYKEFGCLNFEAKSKYMCNLMGDLFLPPAAMLALLKHGPKAAQQFPKLKKLFAEKKNADSREIIRELSAKYPKLAQTYTSLESKLTADKAISHPREIPFNLSNDFRPIKAAEMARRADELDVKTQQSIVTAYNALNDKKELASYFQKLYLESAEWMAKKGRPEDIKLLEEGKVSEHAIAVTMVKRLKADGDTQFTTIMGSNNQNKILSFGSKKIAQEDVSTNNNAFRTAIRTGPFFDHAFPDGVPGGHGPYTHMIQRDIVKQALKKKNSSSKEFFEFLGTKKGVNWWADLFDSSNPTSFTRPEAVTNYMFKSMIVKEK